MSARRGVALLADIPDGQRRDGSSQRVVRRKHAVVPVPVFSRWRHEIGEPVEELKRRQFDDAIRIGPRGFSRPALANPVAGLVPRQHVADSRDAAVCAAVHGESLQCEGGPGAIPQEMFEATEIVRHVAVHERDADARVNGETNVFLGEHVCGGSGVEQASKPEPPHDAASHRLGEGR